MNIYKTILLLLLVHCLNYLKFRSSFGQGCYPYEIKPNGTGSATQPKCHKSCLEGYPKTYAQDKHFGKAWQNVNHLVCMCMCGYIYIYINIYLDVVIVVTQKFRSLIRLLLQTTELLVGTVFPLLLLTYGSCV